MEWLDRTAAAAATNFSEAMGIVNASNRTESFRAISRLISKLASRMASIGDPSPALNTDLAMLQELGKFISSAAAKSGKRDVLAAIEAKVYDVIRVASGMYRAVQDAESKQDLFYGLETPQVEDPKQPQAPRRLPKPPKPRPVRPERPEWSRALPEGLGIPPEELAEFQRSEQGWMDEELDPRFVAAAKKQYESSEILDLIVQASKDALRFRKVSPKLQLDKIRGYFNAGLEGANWYNDIYGVLVGYFGEENAITFAKLLAATSPRQDVVRNMKLAIAAFGKYILELKQQIGQKAEDPTFQQGLKARLGTAFMRTLVPNIMRAMGVGEAELKAELSGSKVNNFSKALAGDPNAVTMDIWMARAMGLTSPAPFDNAEDYEVFANAVRDLAREAGVQPRQYQAAVWAGVRKEWGESRSGASFDVLIKNMLDNIPVKAFVGEPPKTDLPLFRGLAAGWVGRNCRLS